MTPESQRIAIAEACGTRKSLRSGWPLAPSELPDYLNDLNAMHKAEKVLSEFMFGDYYSWLAKITDSDTGQTTKRFELLHSTAAQRAEAFLKCLNLWTE